MGSALHAAEPGLTEHAFYSFGLRHYGAEETCFHLEILNGAVMNFAVNMGLIEMPSEYRWVRELIYT